MFPWLPFLLYIIVMAYTPGPNNIMAMNTAKNVGFRKSLVFVAGVYAGVFFVTILCILFSALLYNVIPVMQFFMKILGAAYMGYLIIKTLTSSAKREEKNSKTKNSSFFIAVALQLINPKLIMYGITVASSYVLPYYNQIQVWVLFAFLLTTIGITGVVCWALFGSLFSRLFSKHGKILNIIMAVLLLYCIISLFI